ncbi:MAG: hypothetical protein ACN6I5_04990 [Hyphomicrobiales bacterium]
MQVITNSVDVAQTLRRHSILVGGTILSDVPATFGELTLAEIGRFIADLAILFAHRRPPQTRCDVL